MKKYIFLFTILTIVLSSCTEDMDKVIDIEVNNNHFDLSEKEAITIAKSFHELVTSNIKTRTSNISFNVKSRYRLDGDVSTRALSNDKAPLIYEVRMHDGEKNGKVIVSGDKRFPVVLAYIPSFNDSLYNVSLKPNIMIQIAKSALLDKIQNYESQSTTRSYPTDTVPGEVSVMIIPFCKTAWHQNKPYNNLLPKAWVEYVGMLDHPGYSLYNHYYTGKSTIAIAQAMTYLQPKLTINNTSIDWNALTKGEGVTTPYEDMAAILIKYVYDTIGTHPVWGKSYNEKWPPTLVDAVIAMETPFEKIPAALRSSQCGLISDNMQDWNLKTVKQSIFSFKPVLIGYQNTDAFLADGYAINEANSSYLHCNFGSGNLNGYYWVNEKASFAFENEASFYRDFTLKIIPNIRNR